MPLDWTPQEQIKRKGVDYGNVVTPEALKLRSIIDQNREKNFVQRLIEPQKYPVLQRPDLGEGGYSTHLMSYSTNDQGAVVYPQVIFNEKTKALQRLSADEAYKYAINTGEHIIFKTPEEAAWFTENYKKALEMDQFEAAKLRSLE